MVVASMAVKLARKHSIMITVFLEALFVEVALGAVEEAEEGAAREGILGVVVGLTLI